MDIRMIKTIIRNIHYTELDILVILFQLYNTLETILKDFETIIHASINQASVQCNTFISKIDAV